MSLYVETHHCYGKRTAVLSPDTLRPKLVRIVTSYHKNIMHN